MNIRLIIVLAICAVLGFSGVVQARGDHGRDYHHKTDGPTSPPAPDEPVEEETTEVEKPVEEPVAPVVSDPAVGPTASAVTLPVSDPAPPYPAYASKN